MDKYLGTVMTIDRVLPMGEYKMIEDEGIWFWNEHCIDGVVKDVEFEEKLPNLRHRKTSRIWTRNSHRN